MYIYIYNVILNYIYIQMKCKFYDFMNLFNISLSNVGIKQYTKSVLISLPLFWEEFHPSYLQGLVDNFLLLSSHFFQHHISHHNGTITQSHFFRNDRTIYNFNNTIFYTGKYEMRMKVMKANWQNHIIHQHSTQA